MMIGLVDGIVMPFVELSVPPLIVTGLPIAPKFPSALIDSLPEVTNMPPTKVLIPESSAPAASGLASMIRLPLPLTALEMETESSEFGRVFNVRSCRRMP